MAAFLTLAGLTGAVISWDREIDGILNSHLTRSTGSAFNVKPLELVASIERADPRVRVTYLPLSAEPGSSLAVFVSPRLDPATKEHYSLGYNQIFVDPQSGRILGHRDWGAVWPVTRETFVSFLYVLHYSLHVPEMWGIDAWGLWLMGTIAAAWMFDAFVGFYLTLPRCRPRTPGSAAISGLPHRERSRFARWRPAWRIKTAAGSYRIVFDLHRALGLWTWCLVFVIAFTAFSLTLYREVFYPVMSLVSDVTPTPFDTRTGDDHVQIEPQVSYPEAARLAADAARSRGWNIPIGAIAYNAELGFYWVLFFAPGDDYGAAGVGPPEIYFDASDGRVLGERLPWQGTLADIFVQAQFPVHSGRILGLPGRILISALGVAVAALSITGVVIYFRKRRARARRKV